MQVRDVGVWKNASPHVKDGGVWKPAQEVWVKDAGVWKKEWQNVRVLLEATYTVNANGDDIDLVMGTSEQLALCSFPVEGTGLHLTLFQILPRNGVAGAQIAFAGGTTPGGFGDAPSLTPWLNANFKGIEIEGQMYLKSHNFYYEAKLWWHRGGAGLPTNALSRHAGTNITIRVIGT